MKVELAATELAEVLSPSQVRCFMDCQVRWWFKYGLQYPDPSTGNLALGRAVHAALAQNFEQKMQSYEDLPLLGVIALFRQAWAAECEEAEFRDDEDPSELARCGENLIRRYLEEVAPTIAPGAVEQHVTGEISGVHVQGWIDVLDVRGRILEIKTAARKPSSISPEYRFQIATYAQLTPRATGDARVDILVKTKSPGLVTQRFSISDQDLVATRELYPMAQMAMRSEHAQSDLDELLAAKLLLLAALRAGMGWRGAGMKPHRDSRYLAWIRTLPCVVCGCDRGIEASHTGPHGLGQKSPDSSAIPLCYRHHRTGKESYHRLGPQKFTAIHDLDIPAIVRRLNTKPVIRIEAGTFVGYLESQQYRLGPTMAGLEPAVRKMIKLAAEDRLITKVA